MTTRQAHGESPMEMLNRRLTTQAVCREVEEERQRQFEKWGEQDHPILPHDDLRHDFQYEADAAKVTYRKTVAAGGNPSWSLILGEEVAEAFAESDLQKVREEMVQVAAVAVAIIENIDRKTKEEEANG